MSYYQEKLTKFWPGNENFPGRKNFLTKHFPRRKHFSQRKIVSNIFAVFPALEHKREHFYGEFSEGNTVAYQGKCYIFLKIPLH